MVDVIIEFLTRATPFVIGFVWLSVVVHRTQVDCARECERVRLEMRRLARELGGEGPFEPPPGPEPKTQAPLPVARVHIR